MAPPADPPTTITLRIKVPPGHIEGAADEFTLGTEVPVSARIGEVRERIQRKLPSNPAPERQRLLYGGRALVDNEQTLADALNVRRDPTQDEFVIHLLIKPDGTATGPAPHTRGVITPSPAQAGQPPTSNTAQPLPHAQPNHDHLHQQYHQQHVQDLQQHHAALLAQHQQQQQILHNLNLNHLAGAHGRVGTGPLPVPPGTHFVVRNAMPHPGQHVPVPQQAAQVGAAPGHTDGSTETRPTPSPGPTVQQPRSASQPPPRSQSQGVVVEGRGPNGEHFHFQQRIQLGPPAPAPQVFNVMHPPPQLQHVLPPILQPMHRRPTPNALEQARDNIAELRQMLNEIRRLDAATDAQRERIDQLEQRNRAVNDHLDPFNLGGSNGPRGGSSDATGATGAAQVMYIPMSQPPLQAGISHAPSTVAQQTLASRTSSQVTCYLLSSPSGPQAVLYSPQHGAFTGSLPSPSQTTIDLTQPIRQPVTAAAAADAQPPANPDQAGVAQPAVVQAAAAAPQNGFGALGPGLINHMWLLMRVLIFAYFIMGANLGWRRPLALLAIAIGYWLLRQGPLGEGGVLRRWWDGVVNQGQPHRQAQLNGQQRLQAQVGDTRPGQMPTPAQVAERLLDEDRQQRAHRLSWLREQIRPAERGIALLVASLWPGVGEAYVRALEAEERRRNEEEVAARRREEEERMEREQEEQLKHEEEKKRAEDSAEGAEVKDSGEGAAADATTSDVVHDWPEQADGHATA